MTDLKRELTESFIKPLKFKFLIEKLRQNSEKNANEKSEKNTELLEKLYSEYEKFKISIPTGMLLYGPPGTGKTFITKNWQKKLNVDSSQKIWANLALHTFIKPPKISKIFSMV